MSNIDFLPGRKNIPVLSVRQPWASLIAEGVKTIEIRKWVTDERGPLAIHASRTLDTAGYDYLRTLDAGFSLEPYLRTEPTGCIIAVVDLKCIMKYTSDVDFAIDSLAHFNDPSWYNSRLQGWHFTNIKKVKPIPHLGILGLSLVSTKKLEVLE